MEKYVINGGVRLKGEVEVSGAKNAVLAILPAVILSDAPCIIENVPNISDVSIILKILSELGAKVKLINKSTVEIDPTNINETTVPYEHSRNIRASYYFLGALLGKFKSARVSMPGGCNFGVRPIDQHLKGFTALNCKYSLDHGMIDVYTDELKGEHIYCDVVSVGATMNIMLAAVKADGLTIIENAAKEPHIVDLANFLNSMGADIMGAGTDVIKIKGVKDLRGTNYSIIPDQIEAGTYMLMGAITKGDILVKNVIPKHLESITDKLVKMGFIVEEFDDSIRVCYDGKMEKINVKTMPHPGFPTDMQPQMTTLLTLANGTSLVTEGVWDNRFKYVDELRRLGADISVEGRVAVVEGAEKLTGAPVKASDLRAGAAMVMAALVAEGITEIEDIHFIERGYEGIEEKLRNLGANIIKKTIPQEVIIKEAL